MKRLLQIRNVLKILEQDGKRFYSRFAEEFGVA